MKKIILLVVGALLSVGTIVFVWQRFINPNNCYF